jgi:hypothetical protein
MATIEELEAIFNEDSEASQVGGNAATLEQLEAIHSEGQSDAQPIAASPRGRRAAQLRQEREGVKSLLGQFEAGEITSQDMTPDEVEQVQAARIAAIPEITGSFGQLSDNLGFKEALATLTTFDPEEFGNILKASDPNISVIKTGPDGEHIAFNRETEEAFSINKIGPSLMDAVQVSGNVALLSPAGGAGGVIQKLGSQALASAGTQAAVEAGQSALGGEFDAGNVVIAGAAVPVVAGAVKAGKGAIDNFRRSVRSATPLIEPGTGAVKPGFQKALDKYDIDAGALIDDQANLPVIFSGDKPEKVVENIIKKQIKTNKPANYIGRLRLSDKGKVITDDLGVTANKNGFDLGDIAAAKSANKLTRNEAQKMLRMQRAIMADKSNVDKFRPSDVVGNSVMERFRFVRNEANKFREQLDKMASKELTVKGRKLIGDGGALKGLEIDPVKVERTVFNELDKLGVEGLENALTGGKPIADAVFDKAFFEGSDIAVDKTSQRIIKDVFKLLKHNPDGPIDALRAHKVKRQIDSLIDFNKKSSQGLTESGRRFAKAVRSSMNDSIREVSPAYAKVNDDLSLALKSMNAVEDSVGRRIDLFDTGAEQAMGTEMRKLLSNYGTRQTLNNSLNQIDDAAKSLGGVFDTNFRELNRFSNVLDRRFGSVAENSFRGNIDAALDLNRLRNTSIKEAVLEKGLRKIADKFGPNDQKAFDVMQKILVRGK